MNHIVKRTLDGSSTIYVPGLNEHYNSTNGALQESEHIFINAGFRYLHLHELSVFEVGFGTGLNAWLTCIEAQKLNRKVSYYTIEKYPLPMETVDALEHGACFGGEFSELFDKIHQAEWGKMVEITPNFEIMKIKADLKTCSLTEYQFDLVYYDAFAPDKQPQMWTDDLINKVVMQMKQGGVFATYTVKGIVKRALKSAGCLISKLPGPPGKREMLRAVREGE